MHPIADALCKTLNEAFVADSDAVRALLCACSPCNEDLAEHPTIQVHAAIPGFKSPWMTMLGLLNGACEEGFSVASIHSDEPDVYGRYSHQGFVVVQPVMQETP